VSPGKIESGKSSALLLLSANESAASWIGPLRIVGKSKAGEAELAREARGGSMLWSVADVDNEPVQSRVTRDLVLAVMDAEFAPISLATAEDKVWETPKGGHLKIPLKVTRRGEFTANLKLKAAGLPASDSLKEIDIDGKAADSALELDLAQQKLSPGAYTFHLQGQTQGKYRKDQKIIQAAEAEAKEAEQHAEKLSATAREAAEALVEATKTAEEAEAIVETATEQEKENASLKAKAATAAKAAAEKASSEAKEAKSKKTTAAKRAKELAEASKFKDVTITVYSPPITVKVLEAEKK
jgi:hypothetical protein